jgi:DNA-binding NtrC family response regulator
LTQPTETVRILIVDDEPSVLLTLAANLELEGFEVLTAGDPRQALELAEHEDFDVLLTDVRMPGMDGVELFRRLKVMKPALRTIVMTAFAGEELLDQGLQEGVYTVLRKPFDIAQLAQLANRAARKGVVMVIDDKPEVGQSLAAALEGAGIPAVDVQSSKAALTRLAQSPVDTCVIDLVMPEMDGAALCEAIHALDRDVTLVVMTGQNVPELVRDAAKAGSYMCLRKPFDVEALVRTVARARRGAAPGDRGA